MIKNLAFLFALLLSGCILYVEPTPSSGGSHSTTSTYFCFEDVYVYCDYNAVYDDYEWHSSTVMGGDYEDISEVVVWFDDLYNYGGMDGFGLHTYGVGQTWDTLFSTYYHACGSSYELVFEAYGIYGEVASTWIVW